MEEVKRLYENYLDQVARLQRERKPFEGVFGLGGGPAAHPCHRQFARDVEQALARMPREERLEAMEYIFRQAPAYQDNPLVYWMFLAVHGAVVPFLQELTPQQARQLRAWYETAYPERDRLPCQHRVVYTLKKVK